MIKKAGESKLCSVGGQAGESGELRHGSCLKAPGREPGKPMLQL